MAFLHGDIIERISDLTEKTTNILEDDSYAAALPPDPSPQEVEAALSEMPRRIEYVNTLIADTNAILRSLRRKAQELETTMKASQAEARQKALQRYQEDLEAYVKRCQEELEKHKDNRSMLKAVQEVLRLQKPVKPTVEELNDVAILATMDLAQSALELEGYINRLRAIRDRLQNKKEALDNKFVSVRAHKSILVEEMRRPI